MTLSAILVEFSYTVSILHHNTRCPQRPAIAERLCQLARRRNATITLIRL